MRCELLYETAKSKPLKYKNSIGHCILNNEHYKCVTFNTSDNLPQTGLNEISFSD